MFLSDDVSTVITGAADIASHLYRMIRESSDGRETAAAAEIAEMRRESDEIRLHSSDQKFHKDAPGERRPTWQ